MPNFSNIQYSKIYFHSIVIFNNGLLKDELKLNLIKSNTNSNIIILNTQDNISYTLKENNSTYSSNFIIEFIEKNKTNKKTLPVTLKKYNRSYNKLVYQNNFRDYKSYNLKQKLLKS